MNRIRLFFLRRRVFVIVEQIRILRVEIHRLTKIYDRMMAENAKRFARDICRYDNGRPAGMLGRTHAEWEATNWLTGYCRPASDIRMKTNGLEEQVQALYDERREIRLKMAELHGCCQTPVTCVEVGNLA
jgi:hypothetical protein